tara:strand:- start:1331 stop:2503 length:1173 start_codon:yes stop_codon:yes gene_type:complete
MNISKWPQFSEEEIIAVSNVLKSGNVNSWTGDKVRIFEKNFASHINSKYSIALANGTLALTSAYEAIGIKQNDEVITTPRTFIATSAAAVLLGAKPVFADIDINTGNIDPESIRSLINKNTKCISVVHLGGWPADMENIVKIANEYNLKVIEDCSQAHGASINNKSVGNFGDIATWSFCQDKIMSTGGEGGMITTNKKEYFEKIWSLKDHGKTIFSVFHKKHPKGYAYKYLHDSFGSNYRMTEMQASIGIIQLKKLTKWSRDRQINAKTIIKKINDISCVRIPFPELNIKHAWYKLYIYINKDYLKKGWSRDLILTEINEKGYPAGSGSCGELYLEKAFQDNGFRKFKTLTNAKELGETSIMLLIHPTITNDEINNYAECIRYVLLKASK